MKTSFLIVVIGFWTIVAVFGIAGLVSYENQKLIRSMGKSGGTDADGTLLVNGETLAGVPEGVTTWVPELVAVHSTLEDCWMTIDEKIYNVSEYVPFHPGGTQTILEYCGTEATEAFRTKGGEGDDHSKTAYTLLGNYFVASMGEPLPLEYGAVAEVVDEGIQTATTAPTVKTAQGAQTQSETKALAPTVPTKVSTNSLTSTTVATHSTVNDCWLIINNKVYDVTKYIPFHPGGSNAIKPWCGKESTNAFSTMGGKGKNHSKSAWGQLDNYYIGTIGAAVTPAPTVSTLTPVPAPASAPIPTPVQIPVPATVPKPTTTPAPASGLTVASVATHNTTSDCWLIINSKVYDVTDYIPFHPGGTNTIKPWCGKESTTAFNTKGGDGSAHSSSANNMLANYYVGALGAVATTPTTPSTSADTTQPTVSFTSPTNGATISGTVSLRATASDAGGVASVAFAIDGSALKSDTSSPYSATLDTTAYANGAVLLTAVAKDAVGNTRTTTISVTISNAVATPPPATGTLAASTVASHNLTSDCWIIVNSKVYNITQYIPVHPGGTNTIKPWCGKESTNAFTTRGGSGSHSTKAWSLLNNYFIGTLGGTTTVTPPTTTTPPPTTTTPPSTTTDPSQPYRDAILAKYPGATISKLSIEDNGTAEFKFTLNGKTYEGKMDASYNITKVE